MLRTGLRNDDVAALVRAVRAGRDSGLGPDEAWARAKAEVHGVDPAVFDGWRGTVEERAAGGTAQVSVTRTANVLERLTQQDEEIANLKRRLSDAGSQYEQAQKEITQFREQLAAAEELLQKPDELPGDPGKGRKK